MSSAAFITEIKRLMLPATLTKQVGKVDGIEFMFSNGKRISATRGAVRTASAAGQQ